MVSKTLTAESTNEQSKAGLTDCTPEEFANIQQLNADYNAKFGFPFILAVRGPRGTGLAKREIIEHLRAPAGQPSGLRARRVPAQHPPHRRDSPERQVRRRARRSATRCGTGRSSWRVHSDPGYAERGQLTVTYLTDAHRACAQQHRRTGCATAASTRCAIDAVGNVVGMLPRQRRRSAKRLLTGSHYDTVRNGGKYDGRLGIFVPMACVRELHARRAGACPSASRSSASPKKKASATRRPSSARAR